MGFFFCCMRAECSSLPQGVWRGGYSPVAELIDELMTSLPRKKNSIVIARAVAGKLIKRA